MRPRDFSQSARAVAAVVMVLDASAAEAWESYRVMSSANYTLGTGEETKGTSRVYKLKRTGPRTEPWARSFGTKIDVPARFHCEKVRMLGLLRPREHEAEHVLADPEQVQSQPNALFW